MLTAAFIALLFACAAGGLWLLMHIGPGWPRSMNDPTDREVRFVGTMAAILLMVALVFFFLGVGI